MLEAGHSHKPRNEWVGDVLYFNPGGAGPRRFILPLTVGREVFVYYMPSGASEGALKSMDDSSRKEGTKE